MNAIKFFTFAAVGLLVVAPVRADITFLNAWGSYGSGNGQFDFPQGVALSPSGQVYVVDTNNGRIQRFSADGTYDLQWGSLGSGDGQFSVAYGVAVSPSGQVYVADTTSNPRIQRFSAEGGYELKWGSSGSGDGQFVFPSDVTVSPSGQVYVADSGNARIQRFSAEGTYDLQWGSLGSGDGQFNSPSGVAVSPSGQVYVADTTNHRVQRFSTEGGYELQWGSSGSGTGQLSFPTGVAVSPNGQVYVADSGNDRIQRFSADGGHELGWGSFGSGDGQFYNPAGVAVSPSGRVYVADSSNHRIQRFFDSDAWVSGTNEFVNTAYGPINVGVGSGQVLGQVLNLDVVKGLTVAGTTTIEADGVLTLSGGSLVSNTLAFNDGLLRLGSSVTLSGITTIAVNPGAGVVDTNGHDLLTNAFLAGEGSLVKAGAGSLTLAGSGAVGGIGVEDGTLVVENSLTAGVANVEIPGTLQLETSGRINGPLFNRGVVIGRGEIAGALTNNAGGEVRVGTGERLLVNSPPSLHVNDGRMEVIGGEAEFRGTIANSATPGLITARNATLRFNGNLENDGALALSFGTSDVFGDISNASGTGSITVGGNSQVTFYDDVTNSGTLNVASGSTAVFFGVLSGNGNSGGGDVQALGDLMPGASAGIMTFGGGLDMGPLTSVEIEIGGATTNDYDNLNITGTATLDGTLGVSLIDPLGGSNLFAPSAGDTFEILTADAGLGGTAFDSLVLPALSGGLEWFVNYGANDVSLVTTYGADFDEDGDVDGFDFLAWQRGYGTATGAIHALGDADRNGAVTAADLAVWSGQLGMSAFAGATNAAIPEPTSVLLLVLAAVGICLHKRCARQVSINR